MESRIISLISIMASHNVMNKAITNAIMRTRSVTDDDEEILAIYNCRADNEKPSRIKLYIENVVLQYNTKQFQMHFRLSRQVFDNLLRLVFPLLENNHGHGRPMISPAKQLLSVLWLLATPDSYRSIGDRFDLGKSSLHHSFVRVIHVLNLLAPSVIKWPHEREREIIKRNFAHFKLTDVVGIIDGMYVPIKAPKEDSDSYICRKRFHAITLQGICVNNLKFSDCFIGYPSSVHDYRIFKNSDIYQNIITNFPAYFTEDEYILGDKAYPLKSWCITPYINRGNLSRRQHYFNTVLSQCRQQIERTFALLKGRFRRLKYLDMSRIDLIPATVLACCVCHNLCLDFQDDEIEAYILEGRENEKNMECYNEEDMCIIENGEQFENEAGTLRRDRISFELV